MEEDTVIAQVLDVEPNDVLTAKQAADLLGIQHRSALKALNRGTLRGRKIGSMWYLTREEVKRYGEERN